MQSAGVVGTLGLGTGIAGGQPDYDSLSAPDDVGSAPVEPDEQDTSVLVIQDCEPWGIDLADVLPYLDDYAVINADQLQGYDLEQHRLVLLPSAQPEAYYDQLVAHAGSIASFVHGGGILIAHAAGSGWPCEGRPRESFLPGGITMGGNVGEYVTVSADDHPILEGITNDDLQEWSTSRHGDLRDLPDDAEVIVNRPWYGAIGAYVEYDHGDGTVLATTMPIEWPWGDGAETVPDVAAARQLLTNEINYVLEPEVRITAPAAVELGESVPFTISLSLPDILEYETINLSAEARVGQTTHAGQAPYQTMSPGLFVTVPSESHVSVSGEFDGTNVPGREYDVTIDFEGVFDSATLERTLEFRTYVFEEVQPVDVLPVAAADADVGGEDFDDPVGDELYDQLRTQAQRANEYFASGLGTMGAVGRELRFPTMDADAVEETYDVVTIEDGWIVLPFTREEYLNVDPDDPTLGEDLDPPLAAAPDFVEQDQYDYKTRYALTMQSVQLALLSDAIDPVVNDDDVDAGSVIVAGESRFDSPVTRAFHWTGWTTDHDAYDGEHYDAVIWDQIDGGAWLHELGHNMGLPDLYASGSPNGTEISHWGQMSRGDQFSAYARAVDFADRPDSDWLGVKREWVDDFDEPFVLDDLNPLSDLDLGDTLEYVRTSTEFETYVMDEGWVTHENVSHWIIEPRRGGETEIARVNLREQAVYGNQRYCPDDDPGVAVYGVGSTALDDPSRRGYANFRTNTSWWSPTLRADEPVYFIPHELVAFELLTDDVEDGAAVRVTRTTEEPTPEADSPLAIDTSLILTSRPTLEWQRRVIPDPEIPHPRHPDRIWPGETLPAVDVLVETEDGERAGTDPETGEVYEEIDGASVSRAGLGRTVRIPAREDLSVSISGERLLRRIERLGHTEESVVEHERRITVDTNPKVDDASGTDAEDVPPHVRGRAVYETTVDEDADAGPRPALAHASVEVEPDPLGPPETTSRDDEHVTAYVGVEAPFDVGDVVTASVALNGVRTTSRSADASGGGPTTRERGGTVVAVFRFPREEVVDILGAGTQEVSVSGLIDAPEVVPFVGTTEVHVNGEPSTDGDDSGADPAADDSAAEGGTGLVGTLASVSGAVAALRWWQRRGTSEDD